MCSTSVRNGAKVEEVLGGRGEITLLITFAICSDTSFLHCKTDESHVRTSQVYKNRIGPDDKCYFTQQHKDQSFVIFCLLDRYSFPVPFLLYQGEI